MVGDVDAPLPQSPSTATDAAASREAAHPLEILLDPDEQQRVGRFQFFLADQRWVWSETVARMHGYEPGTVVPTTELLLEHKHPDDRPEVAAVLGRVQAGEPFSSRHRIIDTAGRTRWVIVVGDYMLTEDDTVLGTSGFYVDITEVLQSDVTTAVSEVSESRAVIEQAKGVLMAAHGISAERAFDILVWRSQETNIKVRDLAARFIDAVVGQMSPGTVSKIDHALLTIT
ncbi:PAS and ANTAR domain-containing protein [Mycobacterium koreense]|uniref:Antitermination regulator n=1 Tax=Mycolicibacillus koreensis TaxID=1069220 RepID=A0A7I7SDL2_9MYCO|nr:PAS and ANTAR domain-containing protein [Mycolicibacillus koreensis]OSC33280.1 antitermination regulator [Mycolicibacillus koreensis]BBY54823.1 putative transcription antitermination regulator [Mycolicibacillus koreensis]